MSAAWGLVIDVARCHDCNNCFLACKDEFVDNEWPGYSRSQPAHGHRWMNILRSEKGEFPLVEVCYLPKPCQHCENPPCVAASNDAVKIRDDGIVFLDSDKAAGQKELVDSCPYGAIFWNETLRVPQKCNMCVHLLDNGWIEPRCVQVCPTDALKVFKLDEEGWRQKIRDEGLATYQSEFNTNPRVLYKSLKNFTHRSISGTVVSAVTDECVEHAEIVLKDDCGRELMRTRTNNYGDFVLSGLDDSLTLIQVEILAVDHRPKVLELEIDKSINMGTMIV